MDSDLKQNIIDILLHAYEAFKSMDSNSLVNLSDRTIHSASIEQDSNSITIAVMVYSLAKVVERRKYQQSGEWAKFSKFVLERLAKARESLSSDFDETYLGNVKQILKYCGKLDHMFSKHIIEVIEFAKIKKGSDVYRQGISLGQAAEIMGITPWELREYVGHTRISDVDPLLTKNAKKRIKEARRIFNLQ